jgi:membrane peptidoglycan carboxypeptidase
MMGPEQATALTAEFRAEGRAATPDLRFALSVVQGTAGSDAWFVGCVPELCLTVWTGGAGPAGPGGPAVAAPTASPDEPSLPARVASETFTAYLTVAPGRISVPSLPAPRAESRRSDDDGRPRAPAAPSAPAVAPPPQPVVEPTPQVRSTSRPSAAPSPAATATATPTPQAPAPTPEPDAAAGNGQGTDDGDPKTVAEGSPVTGG